MNSETTNNIFIKNAALVATPLGNQANFGRQMNNISLTENGAVLVKNGIIEAVGTTYELERQYDDSICKIIDASDKCIIPGFVDSHTHFIFYGYRENEFMRRLAGASYMEIMNAGGGIGSTVANTREEIFGQLYNLGIKRLDEMLAFGVTTVEGKSGYGLDFQTEIRQLVVMRELDRTHPLDVVPTYLGAHAVAPEYEGRPADYIDYIIDSVLPYVFKYKLAEFCDVFCEKNVFNVDLSEKLLQKAKQLGLGLKIHADEICSLGGAELAARLGAVSADHLLNISEEGIRQLAQSRVIATLLPCTAFCLGENFAPARKMIDAGCAVALASDFNPGSCFTDSIPLIAALACMKMEMTPEEMLTALTLNGAAALNKAGSVGSIEKGKKADMLILKYPSYKFLVYNTGINIVEKVIKNGKIVCENN